MRSVSKGQICIGVLLTFLLEMQPCFALDPRFELDLKALRTESGRTKPGQAGTAAGKRSASAEAPLLTGKRDTGAQSGRARASVKPKRARRAESARKAVERAQSRGQRHAGDYSRRPGGPAGAGTVAAHGILRMQSSAGESQDGVRWARQVWERLIASTEDDKLPLRVEGENFSLSLDPVKYPVFPAVDGGRIILDAGRSLPPLVKAIIAEDDPAVRFVAENPADRRRFFASLFSAARFYSVEEGFSVSFGTDPKVTVTSDFKIEKTPESLSDGDIFLVNVIGKPRGIPASLLFFLEAEGFRVVDSTPPPTAEPPDGRHVLYSIRGGDREAMAEALLKALSVDFERDRNLELDDGSASGVNLTVRADIYHEERGRRVVVSFAEANPVQLTLLRLLELKGYKVVMLYPDDDFHRVSQKLLPVFKVPAAYGMHHLWSPGEAPFDVQLSGFVLGGGGRKDGTVVLTNVAFDPLFRELVGSMGYDVVESFFTDDTKRPHR